MLILNKTDLTNEEVGRLLDYLQSSGNYETFYFGKKDSYTVVSVKNEKLYRVDVEYLKRYTKFTIKEEK